MAEQKVKGFIENGFEAVRQVFETSLNDGTEIGASFCVTKDGAPLVDIWGGSSDVDGTKDWDENTIVNVYSTTKTMTFLVAMMLADHGELDFEAPVAKYWPEFAAEGKAALPVKYLMSHSAGLSGWRERMTKEDLYDWEKCTRLLAAQAPLWEPGTASGYHALTQGYLIGEVVRRITGETIGAFFRREVAEPLQADFHIGLPASEDGRVAELKPPSDGGISQGPSNPIMDATFGNPPIDVHETKTRAWRGAEIPAAGGTGNARSVSKVHTILANGGEIGGRRYLSEAMCRKALETQMKGKDLVLGIPVRFGLGFGLSGEMSPALHDEMMFWGGYGGSLILIDQKNRMTLSYVMNRMMPTTQGDLRALTLAGAVLRSMV